MAKGSNTVKSPAAREDLILDFLVGFFRRTGCDIPKVVSCCLCVAPYVTGVRLWEEGRTDFIPVLSSPMLITFEVMCSERLAV